MKHTVVLLLLLLAVALSVVRGESAHTAPASAADFPPSWRSIVDLTGLLQSCSGSMKLFKITNNGKLLYFSCFDENLNAVLWTINSLSAAYFKANGNSGRPKKNPWYTYTNSLKNQYNNGYSFTDGIHNRGHLVPNSDFAIKNEKMKTFHVLNRAPQVSTINAGSWACIERGTKASTIETDSTTVIVTYLTYSTAIATPTEDTSGGSSIAKLKTSREGRNGAEVPIPSAYNKLVFSATKKGRSMQYDAFCIEQPNIQGTEEGYLKVNDLDKCSSKPRGFVFTQEASGYLRDQVLQCSIGGSDVEEESAESEIETPTRATNFTTGIVGASPVIVEESAEESTDYAVPATEADIPKEWSSIVNLNGLLQSCVTNTQSKKKLYKMVNQGSVLYFSCFDEAINGVLWTVNYIPHTLREKQDKRPNIDFYEYKNSYLNVINNGLAFDSDTHNRGHLVPNSDYANKDEKSKTFHSLNRAPQVSVFNGGIWSTIEMSTRDNTRKSRSNTVIVTYVTYSSNDLNYLPKISEKGTHGAQVPVPTTYNKALFAQRSGTNEFDGFCLEQSNLLGSTEPAKITDLNSCAKTLPSGIVFNQASAASGYLKTMMTASVISKQKKKQQQTTTTRMVLESAESEEEEAGDENGDYAVPATAEDYPAEWTSIVNLTGMMNKCKSTDNSKKLLYKMVSDDERLLYFSCFDESINGVLWTVNRISTDTLNEPHAKRPRVEFHPYENKFLNILNNGRAFNSGMYDRGHLVPNSDFTRSEDKERTFHTLNRAPQVIKINGGVWSHIEVGTRDATLHSDSTSIIVTYLTYPTGTENMQTITERGGNGAKVPVPTSYNKLIFAMSERSDEPEYDALCVEQPNDIKQLNGMQLNDFANCKTRPEGIEFTHTSNGYMKEMFGNA